VAQDSTLFRPEIISPHSSLRFFHIFGVPRPAFRSVCVPYRRMQVYPFDVRPLSRILLHLTHEIYTYRP